MKYVFIGLIKFYKKFISPLFPPCCRYYPTCSSYAIEAFRKHGFFKGFILSLRRIIRCNPLYPGGIDYVPDDFLLFPFFKKRRMPDDSEKYPNVK